MNNAETLLKMLEMVDTKSNADEMVKALEQILIYVKTFQDGTTTDIAKIFQALDEFAGKLKRDSEEDQNVIRSTVGRSIADLRVELENRIAVKESAIDKRLSEVKDGVSGTNGKDGQSIIGPAGKDGSPDTPDQVIGKVNQSGLQIAKERVEGLVDAIRMAAANAVSAVGITTTIFFKNGLQIGRAKNINFIEGSNTTINTYQTGDQMNVSISSSAGSSGTIVSEEVPSGVIDGSNVTFTLAHTPLAGTLKVYLNGARQQLGTDYSLSTATLTFAVAPSSPSTLFVDYTY